MLNGTSINHQLIHYSLAVSQDLTDQYVLLHCNSWLCLTLADGKAVANSRDLQSLHRSAQKLVCAVREVSKSGGQYPPNALTTFSDTT